MSSKRTLPGLANKRALAKAALWFEQLWPAVWPALGVIAAYLIAALLDLPALLPPWLRLALLLAALAGAGWLLWRGLRQVERPGEAAAERRLERESGLRHRPLSALQDRPATDTAEAAAVWQVHQARLLRQVKRLRVGRPRPGLARRDRWALRGLAVVGLAAAWVIAGADGPARLWAAVYPGLPSGPAGPGTVVQAWATPPAYTGLPPMFLQPGTAAVSAPAGSHLTVSVTGGRGSPDLMLGDDKTAFHALDAASWQAERDLEASGVLSVRRGGQALAQWNLSVIPDQAPEIAFAEPPGPLPDGDGPVARTRMAWHAKDDYGVVGVQAELRLKDRPDAPPVVLNAPLGGSPKQPHGAFVQDLTPNPWAGLPVVARLVAKDAAGQTGRSGEAEFVLPERAFQHPAAQAVIAVRKQLSRAPDDRRTAREALGIIEQHPELFDNSFSVLLNLHAISALLARGHGQEAVDEAQERMWALALSLEENAAERTAKALEAARQAMRDAMQETKRNPADAEKQAELDKRIQELREAIQKRLEALMEQARRDGDIRPLDPQAPQMDARELDRMAKEMRDAAREGRMDDAQKQMAELEKLLEQLQNARPETGEEREKRNAEKREQGKQQTGAVQDLVQREGGLLDRSRAREGAEQRPRGLGPDMQPGPMLERPRDEQDAPARAQQQQADRAQDQKVQKAMRRALGELMQQFGELTGQVPAPLGEADMAMREAGQAMADGRDGPAGAAQQRAIEALQKGGKAMAQQMARQFGRGNQPGQMSEGQEGQGGQDGQMGEGEDGDAQGNSNGMTRGPRPGQRQNADRRRGVPRDPLGRELKQDGSSGTDESDSTRVPDQMEQARTRTLQDELRKRGAERSRPKPELDYIDRLLQPF